MTQLDWCGAFVALHIGRITDFYQVLDLRSCGEGVSLFRHGSDGVTRTGTAAIAHVLLFARIHPRVVDFCRVSQRHTHEKQSVLCVSRLAAHG